MKNKLCILLLGLGISGLAQSPDDSLRRVFSIDDFMAVVRINHPVAKQADLQPMKGDASVLQAKGAFDPYAFTTLDQKYFDESQYYSLFDGGLKIPTRLGIDLKAGYEQNRGVYRNPENNTPGSGLVYAGLSLPLGQGLFIDQRRAALQQAKQYREGTLAERRIMLNALFYQAGKAYWEWFNAFHVLRIYENAQTLAQQRADAVRQGALFGDRPFIDTVEAGIQVQNRQMAVQQARLDYANASAWLSVFLWTDAGLPMQIASSVEPPPSAEISGLGVDPELSEQFGMLAQNHPELQLGRIKLEQLQIEKRWKQEQLKPKLNLEYNPLAEVVNGDPFAAWAADNYKWGLAFSMPVFLRKERGALQLAKLKIREAELDLSTKNAAINYKVVAALNEWATTQGQADLAARTARDYGALLAAERQLFNSGESSLFLINSRELGYINAQLKQVELLAKNRKAALECYFALGRLAE